MTFVYILTIVFTLFNNDPSYAWAGVFATQARCNVYLLKATQHYRNDPYVKRLECTKVPVQY